MRTLVHNYSSETSTESIYMANAMQEAGHTVKVWNNQQSAFDAFDDFNPDILLTHYLALTKDIAKRVKSSHAKICINVTGAEPDKIDTIQNVFENYYCFQNYSMLPDIDLISPCADVYAGSKHKGIFPEYHAASLFVVDNEDDLKKIEPYCADCGTYHVISLSQSLVGFKNVDAHVSIAPLTALYQNYNKVFVTKPSQAFFDAAYYGNECFLLQNEKKWVFLGNDVVKDRHTPYNRVRQLLESLGENQL